MENYYILKYDGGNLANPAEVITGQPEIDGFDGPIRFDEGVRIEARLPVLRYTKEGAGSLGDVIQTGAYGLVISGKLKKVFDKAHVRNVDYYPLEIYDQPEGKWLTGFYMANILTLVSCVDREKSIFIPAFHIADLFHHEVFSFDDLRLDYDRLSGEKIFRLQEMISLVLVNEDIRDALEKEDLKGLTLVPAEGYKS